MGSGFSKMKKQARLMEAQYEKMQNDMQNTKATGVSGNGLVTVVVNGNKELIDVRIKPECVDPNDVEGLQDLIKAACELAYKNLPDTSSSLGLPGGLSLPF
ncbi:MAG: YbaB/EbfC family nucleoid-associated protein [Chlamydiota bacterium]